MDNFDSNFAPESPDLSEYQTFAAPEPFVAQHPPATFAPFPQQDFYNSASYQAQHIPPSYGAHDPFQPHPHPQHGQILDNTFNITTQETHKTPGRGRPPKIKSEDGMTPVRQKPGPKPKKTKAAEEPECEKPAPGVVEGVDVKTKFPVARIKRIMQADEDVGKVSQVTPTAVSKALELFIVSLTLRSAAVAHSKSSKRITATHLKQAVQADEQFDFLEQIVLKVPDAPTSKSEGAKKRASVVAQPTHTDDEADSSASEVVKRKQRKRKIKAES